MSDPDGWRDIDQTQREEIARLRALDEYSYKRIGELEAALREAIEGWEDGANYKGDYLREKHGDAEGIAKARAVLRKEPVNG